MLQMTKDFVFHTIQGEGKYVGVPSVFIRLSGCNMRCKWLNSDGSVTLCDTPYSSHHPEKDMKSLAEILQAVDRYNTEHVVISGGEPFLQEELPQLVQDLKKKQKFITIETNATIYQETQADFISMSPKLNSSMHQVEKAFQLPVSQEVIAKFIQSEADWQLKFVVNQREDVEEIAEICRQLGVEKNIFLMPQAIRKQELEERSQWVAELARERGWQYADRLHIRLWGAKRAK
mgnify:CR=1 FL=1|tara:strand:- start:1986 stop:2684 length:699 start_codon:yes stop_codon:yes gene_type:complete